MSKKEVGKLKKLKELKLSKAATSFWVVRRKGSKLQFTYSVLRVDIDAKLARRLKDYLKAQFQDRDVHLEAYDFNTADPDEKLLTLDSASTDFALVEKAIDEGFGNPRAKDYGELLNSWAYVVLFEIEGQRVFAWRKINSLNSTRTAMSRMPLIFVERKLVDAEDKAVFMIDPRFDFFVLDGTIFIGHKVGFETSMNYREGMRQKGEELLATFAKMEFLSDVAPIQTYVGDNLHHLRKLAAIKSAGYYNQPDYIAKLMQVVKSEKWALKIENGKIVVEEQTMELLLTLLNNDRLRSPINDEVFDSSAKKAVPKAGAAT
ncbi:MAG: DUF4868 domain-containing protein [Nitrospiraceae bacterium]|nr:DUF4868 domain-containing protein [Nitrospiraceae bacterium]